jgi:class 3 adenylate cyclase
MIRIRKNKALVSPDAKSLRQVRRLNMNQTYLPLEIGIVVGYIVLGMVSASTCMFGILIGTMLRIAGL